MSGCVIVGPFILFFLNMLLATKVDGKTFRRPASTLPRSRIFEVCIDCSQEKCELVGIEPRLLDLNIVSLQSLQSLPFLGMYFFQCIHRLQN